MQASDRCLLVSRREALAALSLVGFGLAKPSQAEGGRLRELVDGPQRSAANMARDPYRHPYETLQFLGMRDDWTVVEILPGGSGYWTEILAPFLRERGAYIAANAPKDTDTGEMQRENAAFLAKMAAAPSLYDRVRVTEFKGDRFPIAPTGTADCVLTFRNVHNWMAAGETGAVFAAFFAALKPGGTLGIEEHRGRADVPQDPAAKSGYVRQDVTIGFAEKAGFRFAGASEVNANPRDTKDYPAGVWTLPPTYRLKDQDRDRYAAIGESDRFLLKFVKG